MKSTNEDLGQKTETKVCDSHGEYETQFIEMLGRTLSQPCPACSKISQSKEIERQESIKKAKHQANIAALHKSSGLPRRFKDKSISTYRASSKEQERARSIAKRYAANFEERLEKGGSLIFSGKPGTGKTHLAAAIANTVINSNRRVLFISVLAMMRRVKSTYHQNSNETEQQAINFFTKPDLLIVDEVGLQKGTETETSIIYEIINGRYEEMLPTIILTNLTVIELGEYIGERVIDRLRENGGAVVNFDWVSYRGN